MNEELLKKARVIMPEENTEIDPMLEIFKQNVAIAQYAAKVRGIPIALFDPVERRTYLRYPDGTRKYH
ncbi:MAG: hypothetical protein EOM05_11970 [Clostridia bacterium]|nr:hypothetical protein [Clostridia bacterium]